jgi:hypothetical protein|eukprot:COSAG06_NODE_566_length_14196_cov_2.916578_15_plen_71_part_00
MRVDVSEASASLIGPLRRAPPARPSQKTGLTDRGIHLRVGSLLRGADINAHVDACRGAQVSACPIYGSSS